MWLRNKKIILCCLPFRWLDVCSSLLTWSQDHKLFFFFLNQFSHELCIYMSEHLSIFPFSNLWPSWTVLILLDMKAILLKITLTLLFFVTSKISALYTSTMQCTYNQSLQIYNEDVPITRFACYPILHVKIATVINNIVGNTVLIQLWSTLIQYKFWDTLKAFHWRSTPWTWKFYKVF
jgi:hypothetical protein